MDKPTEVRDKNEISYFKLNNEINRVVNGNIDLKKDKEAVRALFLEEINPNTVFFHTLDEKLNYLIRENYIDEDKLNMYDRKFIKKLMKQAYDKKFRFKSFMGAYKFYKQYAMKTNNGARYLERYEDRIVFCALDLAQGDEQLAINLVDEMINQRFQPATPTFLNTMKKRAGRYVSCFLIDTADSMDSIARTVTNSLQLSRHGGGVGISLSNLREAGAPIKGIENASSGVVPVMKLLEDSFSYANQLGQRNGAGAVYLNVFHPDVVSFLSTKKENADEKVRVKTLSLGLVVPDKFYELTAKNETMYLFSPLDVEKEYGIPFAYLNITKEYDAMVANENIKKYKISARELENEISKLQQESGYPYILNSDVANNHHQLNGQIIMSNLCVHGETKILTKHGYKEIQKLAGQKVDVWNGEEWSEVDVVQTNTNQELLHIKTDSGYDIKTTPYHKFYVLEWTKSNKRTKPPRYKEVRAGELKPGDALIKFDLPIIEGEQELDFAYDNGFYSGDGTTYSDGRVRLDLYGAKKELKDLLTSVKSWSDIKVSDTKTRLSGAATGLQHKFFVPSADYTIESRLTWLSGYLDADGTATNNNGSQSLQIASINKEFLKEVQLMLQTLGVDSKVTINKEKGTSMLPLNNGTNEYGEFNTQEVYRILINGNSLYKLTKLGLKCNRLKWEVKKPNRECSQFIKVESIEKVDGLHDTFCFNEPKRHMGMFNGLLTGNCSEILQMQTPSHINDEQQYEEVGIDISCNLGSLNIDNVLKTKDIEKTIETSIRALTNVSLISKTPEVPTVQEGNNKMHAVGLGGMSLHSTLAKNKIHYGSEESIEFVDIFFATVRFYALKASNKIAIEKQETFYDFENSNYANGKFFDQYISGNLRFKGFHSNKVLNMFKNIKVPTEQDWHKLKQSVMEHGLFNGYLLAVAPTGSISYINEATASLHPIIQVVEERQEKKTGKTYYPAPGLNNDTLPYYKSAYDIDMRKVIDVYATAQKHIDQGMSLTLFMRSEIPEGMYEWKNGKTNKMTTRDLNILRHYAWNKGIKSIYYIRTFTADGENDVNICESCSV